MASMGDAQRVGQGGLSKLTDGPRTTSDLSKVGSGLTRGPNQGKKLNAAAWSETWPAPGSTLDLDFANDRGWVRGVGQGKSMDAVTFTRASNGNYVKPDGTLSTHANQGALGNNLLTFPQDFDNAAWAKQLNAIVTANVTTAPDETNTADLLSANGGSGGIQQAITLPLAGTYTFSVNIKADNITWIALRANSFDISSANDAAWFNLNDGSIGTVKSGVTAAIAIVENNYFRCSITFSTSTDLTGNLYIYLTNADNSFTAANALSAFIWGTQLELGSTATEYFPTNIGQPRFDWASTASTGAGTIADPRIIPLAANPASNGLLIEEARANRILWCRDATQANWTKTNVTAAKDQTGIDGVANAASSLTATANDGTCIQTITLASGSRTGSVYLKRITGTGNVQVSLDGSTYSTVDLSASEWRRIVLSGTVTNPTVGIKLAVSGDAVAMDYGQVEDGAFATSPILTTTASVTRAIDSGSLSGNSFFGWYTQQKGTIVTEFVCRGFASGARVSLEIGMSGARIAQYLSTSSILRRDVSGGGPLETTLSTFINTPIKTTYSFSNTNFAGYDKGGAVGKNFTGQVPYTSIAYLCAFAASQNLLNGTLKRVYYIPESYNENKLIALAENT
jgi:hypothetical protein